MPDIIRNELGQIVDNASEYTPELGERICDEISDGKTLPEICAMEGMPSKKTILRWVRRHAEFEHIYRSAQQDRAEGWVEEIVTIADDTSGDYFTDEDGKRRADTEHINRSRLKVDTRKWIACKVIPKLYGDKVDMTHSGPDGGAIPHSVEFHIVDHRPKPAD